MHGSKTRVALRALPALLALGLVPFALAPAASTDAGQSDLAAVRQFTAGLSTPAKAAAAGWFDSGLPCFDNPGTGDNNGGMGLHWLREAPDNAEPDPARPEALVFETRPNGKQKLVAVEYVVDYASWPSAQPPMLFGQPFTTVTLPGGLVVYKLHAWIWKPNPNGMFADYNPRVTLCG